MTDDTKNTGWISPNHAQQGSLHLCNANDEIYYTDAVDEVTANCGLDWFVDLIGALQRYPALGDVDEQQWQLLCTPDGSATVMAFNGELELVTLNIPAAQLPGPIQCEKLRLDCRAGIVVYPFE